MILREALQTPIGAKLKFSQFGFIPTQNAKDWIKIPNYHFKTKEKVIFVIFNGNHINQKLHHFYIRIFLTGKTPYLTGVKISVNKKCSCSLLYKELVVHSEYVFRYYLLKLIWRQVFLLPLFFLLPLSISTAALSDSTATGSRMVSTILLPRQ